MYVMTTLALMLNSVLEYDLFSLDDNRLLDSIDHEAMSEFYAIISFDTASPFPRAISMGSEAYEEFLHGLESNDSLRSWLSISPADRADLEMLSKRFRDLSSLIDDAQHLRRKILRSTDELSSLFTRANRLLSAKNRFESQIAKYRENQVLQCSPKALESMAHKMK